MNQLFKACHRNLEDTKSRTRPTICQTGFCAYMMLHPLIETRPSPRIIMTSITTKAVNRNFSHQRIKI